jgi:hypothetical protein
MLGEREVVTVAFGNYSSLVVAQWANGTSHYDVHHPTLYTDCRIANVLGGGGGGGDGGNALGQRTRVPRLLLLDAPYAATFDDVAAWEEKYNSGASSSSEDNEESGRRGRGRHIDTTSASSVLWGSSGTAEGRTQLDGGDELKADPAARRLDGVTRAVQRHLWAQHGLDEDGSDDEEVEEEKEEEAEAEDYKRLRRQLGIAPYNGGWAEKPNKRIDGHAESTSDATAGEDECAHRRLTNKEKSAKLKKKLFDTHNSTIPWWQYITTGLAAHSVTSVKPLQHVDAAGDIPALHSFGYGVSKLQADKRSEVAELTDALRSQLESADQLQGVQCFVDGDGMFGGAAHNVLEQLWDEAGAKTAVVVTCLFSPLPRLITDRQSGRDVAFRERRQNEAALNQLLATTHLSRHTSAVYIPIPLAQWGDFFRGTTTATTRTDSPHWLEDERATAQYVAAVMDTALYGVRDGNSAHRPATDDEGRRHSEVTTLRVQGPVYYLDDWCRVVRPAPSLRVAAAMGALPQPVAQSTEFWKFLEANPLLPGAPMIDERMGTTTKGREEEADESAALKTGFVPLTHAMSAYSPLHSSGQVLGHAVSLRGAGVLPSTVYPTREAMLRYALPLGTSTYLPLVTESNYPISGTFPMELMFADPAAAERQLPRGLGSLRDALRSVDVGAHVLSTYASAPMLRDIVSTAQAALRFKTDRYCAAYEMEKDDWRETVDEGLTMYDDYHHAAPSDAEGSDDDGDY